MVVHIPDYVSVGAQVEKIEKTIGAGQVEELIEQAKDELVLIPQYAGASLLTSCACVAAAPVLVCIVLTLLRAAYGLRAMLCRVEGVGRAVRSGRRRGVRRPHRAQRRRAKVVGHPASVYSIFHCIPHLVPASCHFCRENRMRVRPSFLYKSGAAPVCPVTSPRLDRPIRPCRPLYGSWYRRQGLPVVARVRRC